MTTVSRQMENKFVPSKQIGNNEPGASWNQKKTENGW